MSTTLLVAGSDPRYREWLRNHLGVLLPDGAISAIDLPELQARRASLTRAQCDLLVLVTPFGADPADPHSPGLEWLRQLRDLAHFPPVVAVAEDGNELTAVRAMQLGAADYLPQRLVTPERLGTAVRLALRRAELEAAAETEDEGIADTTVGARVLRDPIPGYLIRKTISQSEKAMVYLATSEALGQDVALKVTRGTDDSGEALVFAREYQALSALRHSSIVNIHDYGTHDGREYLAMEYFPRGDLKARLQRGIVEGDALRYLEQIARTLQVVHGAGILHRDLKPPNLMLREDDTVVLIDFGLARQVSGQSSTRVGVLRGSPYYMSPEQALGEELDHRTDLYSLGVVFYEMLCGRKPYTGVSAIEVLQQHVNAPLPLLPPAQAHLQPLLDGLLAKAPADRFPTASEAVQAIAGLRVLRLAAGRR